jgi:SPFH domain / Band 7 family
LEFRTHLIWRVKPDKVEEFVEKYSGSNTTQPEQEAYNEYLKETFRTYSRDEVQKIEHGLDVKDNLVKIGDAIKLRMSAYVGADSPIDIIECQVGNIQYPTAVSNAVASKLAATQRLEQADTEIQIEQKKALIREADATGVAQSMNIINQKLTPQYLQHEAIEAQKAMAGPPNHTVIYIPVGKMGIPLVGTFDSTQKEQ